MNWQTPLSTKDDVAKGVSPDTRQGMLLGIIQIWYMYCLNQHFLIKQL
jgi:hypothetical protein